MTPGRKRLVRIGLLAGLVVALLVIGELTGLRKTMTIARLRELTLAAGAWGVLIYTGAFIVGVIIHVPGLSFVAAGLAIWGPWPGVVIVWLSSALAISGSFLAVRAVGGDVLSSVEHPWFERMLAHLEDRPVRTVAILRAVLMISPPVTYALALSPVRFRAFFVGSTIGLLPPMIVVAIFFERVLAWIGAT